MSMETTPRNTAPRHPFPKFGDDLIHTVSRIVLSACVAAAAGYAAATYAGQSQGAALETAAIEPAPESQSLPAEWRWERNAVSFDDMRRTLRDSPVASMR